MQARAVSASSTVPAPPMTPAPKRATTVSITAIAPGTVIVIATVREDRTRVRYRIQSLLATQGIRLELRPGFVASLAAAQTGDGRALPEAFRVRLEHEWAHLDAIEARMTAVTTARDEPIATGTDRVAAVARQLCQMRGVAETRAAVFSAELFGTRTFRNGRQLGALMGRVPVPYRCDQRVQDQGISKAGRAELRRISLQLAWCWVRWQPTSALTQWFLTRFGPAGGRSQRIGIVAVARKLAIALWQYVEHGIVPEGATVQAVERFAAHGRVHSLVASRSRCVRVPPVQEPSDRWSGSPLRSSACLPLVRHRHGGDHG